MRATIPLVERVEPASFGHTRQPLLSDAQAAELQEHRRQGLRVRASVLGSVALIILIVWALTGAPNAWPVWPLLSLGLIAALDAWGVLGTPPARHSDLDGRAGPARACGAAAALRATAGKLAIVNVFLIGIWVAAGARLLLAGLGHARIGRRDRAEGRSVAAPPDGARAGHALVAPALRLFVDDRLLAALAGADADRLLDRVDEHAAVADVAGAGGRRRSRQRPPRPCPAAPPTRP